ncbi:MULTISPECIES: Eco57I restriction-modification methylase domain-containing protein [Streptomyces]|uniref:Eco57I restriction-modification methylase domain-containing protein n=1 Tax=Streptomyces TaxID=1883 RepID=UPI001319E557
MAVARTKAEGLEMIRELVARFAKNRSHYVSRTYDEASTRTHFIDPFFEALGWHVTDSSPEREVVFHDRSRITTTTAGEDDWDADLSQEELDARASRTEIPDYAFRINGELQFYVEAKRPRTGIRGKSANFQIKSYAWNQRLSFSVITDFDELRVFQTSQRPDKEKPRAGLMPGYELSFKEYERSWDKLWDLLSRESIVAGVSIQAAKRTRPRGATPVDEAFLRDLEQWREELGNDLLRNHPDLENYQLEDATQRILDRLVFIRVIEDRGIESDIILRKYARMRDAYRSLCREFRRLDAVYNGQLFAEHYSERLEVSDGLIQRIIAGLYAVDGSPYRFDTFQADFLGQVYERFLGKEFDRRGTGVTLVSKPEVRHAGGVYYTPRWVVDYMVSSSLTPLLAGKTPNSVAKLRFVDPACGSGTFLLGILDFLIQWHERYYDENPEKDPHNHYLDALGRRRLTSDFKGQIIVNNVFGVDVDPRAVEVAQMSLYLRVLEEETETTLQAQPRLFEGARLPTLARNVRAGNSLIAEADVESSSLSDTNLMRRINPFDWRDAIRGFGRVFSENGGFDAVIGNPPYTRVQVLRRLRPEETAIMEKKFRTAVSGFDIATLFTENGLSLLRPASGRNSGGVLSYITSRTFVETDAGAAIRKMLADASHVSEIVDFQSGRVFEEASAYTLILRASSRKNKSWRLTRVPEPPSRGKLDAALSSDVLSAVIPSNALTEERWTLSLPTEDALLRKLSESNPSLNEVSGNSIFQGVITGKDDVFRCVDEGPDPLDSTRRLVRPMAAINEPAVSFELSLLRPVLAGKSSFSPFHVKESSEWLIMPYEEVPGSASFKLIAWPLLEASTPAIADWLKQNETALRNRAGKWDDNNWYSYSRRQNLERFASPKILVPSMIDHLCAHYDEQGHYFVNVSTGGYGINVDTTFGLSGEYIAALLNSALLSWVLKRISRAWRGGWFEARKGNLGDLPIKVPSSEKQQEIVQSYRRVCAAVRGHAESPGDPQLERIATTARESFDYSIYSLYGIEYDEIALIEGATI